MKLDLWRALGVGSGSILSWMVAGLFVYSLDVEMVVADYLMLAVSAVILSAFSHLYFKGSKVAPSAPTGFLLAIAMYGYNFLVGFVSSFLYMVQDLPEPVYPEVTGTMLVLGTLVSIAAPTLTGWYLSRK